MGPASRLPRSEVTGANYGLIMEEPKQRARGLIRESLEVVVLTGAGISTASGIPDFRGPEGVWTKDPHAEMLSTYETWLTNAEVRRAAWRSRVERANALFEPNDAHFALGKFEQHGSLKLLVTQNIDGLHQRAGSSPKLIIEIHGSAQDSLCLRCGHRQPIELTYPRIAAGDDDPTCLEIISGSLCGGMLKSAVISFGQSLVADDLARAEQAARQCDLLVAIGSTLAVYPAAGIVPLAHQHGAHIIIVNGSPTSLDELADIVVSDDINNVVPQLFGD